MEFSTVLLFWFIHLVNFVTVQNYDGFQQKTACFVDYIPSEEELEGEGQQWRGWGGNGMDYHQPHHHIDGFPGAGMDMNLGYPMDREEMMERMGYGEMDENENEEMQQQGYYPPHATDMSFPWGETLESGHFGGGSFGYGENAPRATASSGHYLDADGEWEDLKRRRKRRKRQTFQQRQYHSPMFLYGSLHCNPRATIHISNVTLGYSLSPYCRQAMPGCQATSYKAKQVLHCQGQVGSCQVSISRHFLGRCGNRVNFARVAYECIATSHQVDICTDHNSDETGPVTISSSFHPNASLPHGPTVADSLVTCECTLRAASPSVFQMAYLRSNFPGKPGACNGDLLLIEHPVSDQGDRYQIEAEICGVNYTTAAKVINSNILRLTFLGGSPVSEGDPGFVGKFQALTSDGQPDLYHVSCQSSLPKPEKKTVPTGASGASVSAMVANDRTDHVSGLRKWLARTGRQLPANFDLSSLPANFYNMSREELKRRMRQNRPSDQSDGQAHDVSTAVFESILDSIAEYNKKTPTKEPSEDDSGNSGVLSGVVASLASVIVIIGSLVGIYFYSRLQKKRRHLREIEAPYDTSSSTDVPPVVPSSRAETRRDDVMRREKPEVTSTAIYSIASTVPFSTYANTVEEFPPVMIENHSSLGGNRTPMPPPRRKKGHLQQQEVEKEKDDEDEDHYDDSNIYDADDDAAYDNACNFTTLTTKALKPPPRRKCKSRSATRTTPEPEPEAEPEPAADCQEDVNAEIDDNYASIDDVVQQTKALAGCVEDVEDEMSDDEK